MNESLKFIENYSADRSIKWKIRRILSQDSVELEFKNPYTMDNPSANDQLFKWRYRKNSLSAWMQLDVIGVLAALEKDGVSLEDLQAKIDYSVKLIAVFCQMGFTDASKILGTTVLKEALIEHEQFANALVAATQNALNEPMPQPLPVKKPGPQLRVIHS